MISPHLREAARRLQKKLEQAEPVKILVLADDTEEEHHSDYSMLKTADVYFRSDTESIADIDVFLEKNQYEYVLNFTDLTPSNVVSLGVACTGGPFYSKRSIRHAGVRVPKEYTPSDTIPFPVVMKLNESSGSIGISKVYSHSELRFSEDVLVEEFIDGREFDVLVVENENDPTAPSAFAIEIEFKVPGAILDYERKWDTFSEQCRMRFLDEKREEDARLDQELKAFVVPVFVKHELNHYCRFDIRRRATTGELFLLDINPYCGVFYPRPDFGPGDSLVDRFIGHERFVQRMMLCDCRHILGDQRRDGLGLTRK